MNILMVEDDHQDAELLRLTLQRANLSANIELAQTMAQARQQVRHSDYDVVLLDLGLPDSDGLNTVRQLQSANDAVPIVVLSGYDDDEFARQAVHLGAEDYMVKGVENGEVIVRALLYAIERHRTARELRYLALHDPLTGALNRAEFVEEVDRSISSVANSDRLIGVFSIDMDHFDAANQQLGHEGGDQLLRDATQRVRGQLRRGDLIARLDGDSIAVALPGIDDERAADRFAERIHEAFAKPFEIDSHKVFLTVSIGVALYPGDDKTGEDLLNKANSALRQAKERGRNRSRFFSDETNQRLRRRRALRSDLEAAIEQQQFEVSFQPRFKCGSADIHSIAAELLWQHPAQGPLEAQSFVANAEREGLIERIEERYIDALLDQLCNWAAASQRLPFVSFSISASLLRSPYFAEHLEKVLLLRSLPPGLVEIGVTESALLERSRVAVENIYKLNDLGTRLAVADIATHRCPLRDIAQLPFESVNIERELVADLDDHGTAAVVRAVTTFAQDLGLTVSAEGVENEAQLGYLSDVGCDVVQGGFLLGPLSAERMDQLLKLEEGPERLDVD